MAGGLGTLATTNIITKGISGGPACRGLITTHFSLWAFEIIIPVQTGAGSNGGSRPYMPGEIQNFYKTVTTEQPQYYVPRNQEAKYTVKMVPITVKMKFNGVEYEKLYSVPEKQATIIANIINLTNSTINKIKVSINNLKSNRTGLIAKIQNLKKK
jgi:hypothetical protein